MPDRARGPLLVVGSMNADLVVRTSRLPRPGETVTGSDLVVSPGGKSSNQAAAAALLGADVRLLGRVGDDGNADLLLARARAAGVDIRRVERLPDVATGTAMIAVDRSGENFIIVSPGANAQFAAADVVAAADFFADGSVLCLCLEVDLSVVQAAAEAANAAGATVVLNPSPFQDLDERLLRLVDVLVVNEHELADLVGGEALGSPDAPDWERVLEELGSIGPRHVVVTLGSAGAVVLALDAAGAARVHAEPAPRVEVVDTTGCGDAFLGALASRLALGEDPGTACRFAVQVGSFAATRPGAQESYPTAAELDRFTGSLAGARSSAAEVVAEGASRSAE
ncbi:ribokinase [Modestobacter sp. I12A-02662]|uniref:ribokinase n=1 Tax=Modestobacter sp. I12A-02662 TaxID=1730496 RepID=UPI0034DF8B7E